MNKLDLKYKLTYQEAYDTLYVLATRRSRRTRILTGGLLTLAAIAMLILYAMNDYGFHYMFLAVCAAALLFFILYQPVLKARKGARRVEKLNGEYHVVLHNDGTIDLPGNESIMVHGDKYARVAETDTVFAFRPDQQHTICIPKRVLNDRQTEFVREHFKR